jgi:uncharacterized protein YbjT (DUF2867 family)
MNKAIIAGASGLIGGHLLHILLQSSDYKEVVILVRKDLSIKHDKLKQVIVDFDQLNKYAGQLTGDVIFSCLGSTLKKTPDLAFYRKIDHDYPLQLAKIAVQNGIGQYHLVSSMGANSGASNFYRKLKGEVEEDIEKAGLRTLHIYRPAFLTGDRKEHRPAEGLLNILMKIINPLLVGSLKNYRSIPAKTVAMAMYKQSLIKQDGVFIHPSYKIKELA